MLYLKTCCIQYDNAARFSYSNKPATFADKFEPLLFLIYVNIYAILVYTNHIFAHYTLNFKYFFLSHLESGTTLELQNPKVWCHAYKLKSSTQAITSKLN